MCVCVCVYIYIYEVYQFLDYYIIVLLIRKF